MNYHDSMREADVTFGMIVDTLLRLSIDPKLSDTGRIIADTMVRHLYALHYGN